MPPPGSCRAISSESLRTRTERCPHRNPHQHSGLALASSKGRGDPTIDYCTIFINIPHLQDQLLPKMGRTSVPIFLSHFTQTSKRSWSSFSMFFSFQHELYIEIGFPFFLSETYCNGSLFHSFEVWGFNFSRSTNTCLTSMMEVFRNLLITLKRSVGRPAGAFFFHEKAVSANALCWSFFWLDCLLLSDVCVCVMDLTPATLLNQLQVFEYLDLKTSQVEGIVHQVEPHLRGADRPIVWLQMSCQGSMFQGCPWFLPADAGNQSNGLPLFEMVRKLSNIPCTKARVHVMFNACMKKPESCLEGCWKSVQHQSVSQDFWGKTGHPLVPLCCFWK